MIKHKIITGFLATSLAISGSGIAIINASKLNSENQLAITNQNVSNYVDKVNSTIRLNENIINNIKNENDKLTKKNNVLEKSNSENIDKLKSEESKNEILEKKLILLQKENGQLQNKNKELVNENDKLTNEKNLLTSELGKLNKKIKNLLDALSIIKGNSDYKDMSSKQQSQIIATLLHYWGYKTKTSKAIASILQNPTKPWDWDLKENKSNINNKHENTSDSKNTITT
ncbi:hypothetical protein [Clostridium thermobutyricum]|uniref:hypothetical protein n=1 Tax=Clostridium thermobutyricum TaxID=29372 RepID=UPI003F5285EC